MKKLFEQTSKNKFRLIKEDEESENYTNLGWANSWHEGLPDMIQKCRKLGHQEELLNRSSAGSERRYGCHICKYYYDVDSSG